MDLQNLAAEPGRERCDVRQLGAGRAPRNSPVIFQNPPGIPTVLHLPKKLQHRHHRYDDARQTGADGNDADRLFLELIKSVTEFVELGFHPVVTVLTSHDDFQCQQAAVEGRELVAHGFPA